MSFYLLNSRIDRSTSALPMIRLSKSMFMKKRVRYFRFRILDQHPIMAGVLTLDLKIISFPSTLIKVGIIELDKLINRKNTTKRHKIPPSGKRNVKKHTHIAGNTPKPYELDRLEIMAELPDLQINRYVHRRNVPG